MYPLAHVLQAVRHQAAAVLAALALSSPPLLARLFGECLEGVETFCQQLMLLAAPYTKPRGPAISSVGSSGGASTNNPGMSISQCVNHRIVWQVNLLPKLCHSFMGREYGVKAVWCCTE